MDDVKTRITAPQRLQSLAETGLMDSTPEQSFDRLTSVISRVLGVPVSLVSLVDNERQFFKSSVGLDERETPLSHSFCQYVVADATTLVVADAREEPRLRGNKAIEELNVIAYLGVPIVAPDDEVLGSLCAIDTKPKTWTQDDIDLVQELAGVVMSEIAARQQLRERETVDAALSSSESHLALALAAGRMGAWDWDLETDEVVFSTPAYEIWGVPEGEAVTGKLIFSLMHDEDVARVEGAVQAALESDEDFDTKWRIHRGGDERWLVGRGSIVRDAKDKPVRMLGVNYDITQEVRTRAALEQLNEELEERIEERTHKLEVVNKELEAFNYSVSHDLRAPLRGIDGFSSALQNEYGDTLDETANHYLSRVRAGAQRMGELIDDLLALSRLSKSDLRLSEVDVTQLTQNVFHDLLDIEPERDFRIEIAPNLKAIADKRLLTVALENLLGNAVKFTEPREVSIVSFGRSEDGVFFIRDNGVGFDMKYADKLFIPFQRLHTQKEFRGSGIGLTTVQRIINRHGGRLWAESALDEGTTFYFTLPTPKAKGQPS